MGYFKQTEIEIEEAFDEYAERFVREIAPFLKSNFCDESPDELLEIWHSNWEDYRDELEADFNPMVWARYDCYYANQLFAALQGFVIISMENDW